MAGTITALVLAAGQSRRMGGANKLLCPVDGTPMLTRVVDSALKSRANPVIVVTGFEDRRVRHALEGREVTFVHNPDYAQGMATSLGRGVKAAPRDTGGIIVCLGDMPHVAAAHIDRLIATHAADSECAICVPVFDGRRGNPVLWDRRFFAGLAAIEGDTGGRALLKRYADCVCTVEMEDSAILGDVDTPEDLAALKDRDAASPAPPKHEAIAYHEAILSLADAHTGEGRLKNPTATATAHNPYCGDRVTMDVNLSNGTVTELAHRVRGCVLCEAAASVAGARAAGQTRQSLTAVIDGLAAMLAQGEQPPMTESRPELWPELWHELEVFTPVSRHKSRHACVLLPFQALLEAMEKGE